MFTTNFFQDNSQLNFGKHLRKPKELSKSEKSDMRQVVKSLIKAKQDRNVKLARSGSLIFSISLVISLSLVITAFEWQFKNRGEQVQLGEVNSEVEDFFEIPPTEQVPPPPPPKVRVAQIIEVPDIEEIKDEIEVDLDIEITEDTKIEEVVYEAFDELEEEETDEVFIIVEQQPIPIGGMSTFYSFVGEHLEYPNKALNSHVGGKVYVQFVVNKDGSLGEFEIVKGIGYGCDDEALRIFRLAPKWLPGKQRGRPVKVRMIMPIHFVMKER